MMLDFRGILILSTPKQSESVLGFFLNFRGILILSTTKLRLLKSVKLNRFRDMIILSTTKPQIYTEFYEVSSKSSFSDLK